jgi:hypothetical protein
MSCARCNRSLERAAYRVRTSDSTQLKCLRCALIHPPLMRRAFLTALVVGSILTTINQLDLILGGAGTGRVFLKVGLTYIVPYCVTTWGALSNARQTTPVQKDR